MVDTVKPLPARQRDVINLIVSLTDEHGYPPTLAELATALGLKNRMTVHQHVAALKKKGLVHWEPGLNRSLRVLADGLKAVGHGEDLNEESQASIAGFAASENNFGAGISGVEVHSLIILLHAPLSLISLPLGRQ